MHRLVIAVLLAVVGLRGLFWVYRDTALTVASRHWVAADATIDRSWIEKTFGRDFGPNYSLEMIYHFTVDGKRYAGNRFELPSRRSAGDEGYFQQRLAPYRPGSVVRVLYDPQNPTLSVVTRPYVDYFFIIVLGGFALCFCLSSCFLVYAPLRTFFARHHRSQPPNQALQRTAPRSDA